MKINCIFDKFGRIFFLIGISLTILPDFWGDKTLSANSAVAGSGEETGEIADSPPKNGLPFLPVRDKPFIDRIFEKLTGESKNRYQNESLGYFGYLSLIKQASSLAGKSVSIEGRLLKTETIDWGTTHATAEQSGKIYESWILLDDEKTIPIRLITLKIPEQIDFSQAEQSLRQERITAAGIYYRSTSYFDGTDFIVTPTIVAGDFEVQKTPGNAGNSSASSGKNNTNEKPVPAKQEEQNRAQRATIVTFEEKIPILLSLRGKGDDWRPIASPENNFATAGSLERWNELREQFDGIANDPIVELRGKLLQASQVSLAVNSLPEPNNRSEQKIWRCVVEVQLGDKTAKAIIISPTLPDFRINSVGCSPLSGNADILPDASLKSLGIGQRIGATAYYLTSDESDLFDVTVGDSPDLPNNVPIFITGCLQWYPTTGRLAGLDFDVASLARVPVFDPKLVDSVGTPDKLPPETSRLILQSLRFTGADQLPFYGLLAACNKANGDSTINKLTFDDNPTHSGLSIAEKLFNHPHSSQGEIFTIRGMTRRIEPILVSDSYIQKRFGIDRYYQMALFTDEAQGNPMIVCFPQLPAELKTGSTDDYHHQVETTAIFYKTWAYRAEKGWVRVPLLVGLKVTPIPADEDESPPAFFTIAIPTITIILILLLGLRTRIQKFRNNLTQRHGGHGVFY